MLHNLDVSDYAVNRNYQELSSAISAYEVNLEIWNMEKREILRAFLRELSRLLHNYLSSTFSLIRHNVKVCEDLHCAVLSKEYSEKLRVLEKYDCISFVKDLRNFSQHVGLPIPSAQLQFGNVKGVQEVKQKILLDKEALLGDWAYWKPASKRYVQMFKEIDLKVVLSEYQGLITWFYEWFYKRATQLSSEQIREVDEIETEIRKLET